jgi:ABC-2 type transport system ATP-binding protein
MMTLRFDGVSFAYGAGLFGRGLGTRVFEDFSWEVPSGRTVLLGPNGAGKTTLLGLGASALMPAAGSVRMGTASSGERRQRAAFRRAVGWMPQQVRAIAGLSCREQVAYAGWLKGLGRRAAWEAAGTALERVDLVAEAGRRTSSSPAASSDASASHRRSSTGPTCCSSTSRRRASTPTSAPASATSCARCRATCPWWC